MGLLLGRIRTGAEHGYTLTPTEQSKLLYACSLLGVNSPKFLLPAAEATEKVAYVYAVAGCVRLAPLLVGKDAYTGIARHLQWQLPKAVQEVCQKENLGDTLVLT